MATGPSISPLRTPTASEEREMLKQLKAMNRAESTGGAALSDAEDMDENNVFPYPLRRSISRKQSASEQDVP